MVSWVGLILSISLSRVTNNVKAWTPGAPKDLGWGAEGGGTALFDLPEPGFLTCKKHGHTHHSGMIFLRLSWKPMWHHNHKEWKIGDVQYMLKFFLCFEKINWFAIKRGCLTKYHIIISYPSLWEFTHMFTFSHNNAQEIHDIFQVLAKFYLSLLTYETTDRGPREVSLVWVRVSADRQDSSFPWTWGILPNFPYAGLCLFTCLVRKNCFFLSDIFFSNL